MPAYRSSSEAEIRDAVVARIRERRPDARIIHEINVSSHGPNRMDLIAVDRAEIIAVEIKSAKDKLDRLEAQVKAMRGCAHHVVAAIHEKFMVERVTNDMAAHYQRGGEFYRRDIPEDIRWGQATVWVFPEIWRSMASKQEGGYDFDATWRFPEKIIQTPAPAGAIDLLWRDELYELCGQLRVSATRRSTMPEMVSSLRWHCNGKELTLGICRALRARACTEADAPMYEAAA
ncbi:NERD domain-containing protein [Rhizobium bangladeshense]|uniref:NERD domain-containing protein n=1 Tax=Rhizobium bangladeshense TaxID=1138189 RepID=UPI001C83E53F|nr:NERD domain-containing protein [Rhizobium bangladeshense]MBX4889794.1 NERD domain-containing protein [Rhizobium bangladeshense]